MRVNVDFHDQSLELELSDDHLVAAWQAPVGRSRAKSAEIVREALAAPRDFPPLYQTVVPGDRVTIAFDPSIPDGGLVLEAIVGTFRNAGIEAEGLTVLLPAAGPEELKESLPQGATLVVHDPDDRSKLAYLAATKEGRRIYLNRSLTDADMVLPVGRIGFDPILGYRGPWSVLFPGLADRATIDALRGGIRSDGDAQEAGWARAHREESHEVSWLLGTQFHVGVIPGKSGIAELAAGRDSAVSERGIAALEERWTFRPGSRAEIVVAGVGGPSGGAPTSLHSLADGLATAKRLVQHGGKIVLLSCAAGVPGPALRCLIDAGGTERGLEPLRGHEQDADFHVASRIAEAVAWADVFLYSGMDRDVVEDLSIVPLEKPEQARRLVAQARSTTVVSLADLTRAVVQVD
jgi:hypothetical protein